LFFLSIVNFYLSFSLFFTTYIATTNYVFIILLYTALNSIISFIRSILLYTALNSFMISFIRYILFGSINTFKKLVGWRRRDKENRRSSQQLLVSFKAPLPWFHSHHHHDPDHIINEVITSVIQYPKPFLLRRWTFSSPQPKQFHFY